MTFKGMIDIFLNFDLIVIVLAMSEQLYLVIGQSILIAL